MGLGDTENRGDSPDEMGNNLPFINLYPLWKGIGLSLKLCLINCSELTKFLNIVLSDTFIINGTVTCDHINIFLFSFC